LAEAVYSDSKTRDLKFVSPDLISNVRVLEERIEEIKQGMSNLSTREDVLGDQAARFAKKWR